GFYSKDIILLTSWDFASGGPWFWAVASAAAFVTALYSARMIFLVFFGTMKTEPEDRSGPNMWGPLVVLALLAVGGGWFGLAPLADVLPDGGLNGHEHSTSLVWITAAIPILGVVLGILIFGSKQIKVDGLLQTRLAETLRRFWFGGWGFDTFYDQVLVRPFVLLAGVNKNDVVDLAFRGIAALARSINRMIARTQTGRLRWYASSMAFGLAVVLLVVLEVL
ncbi:MAG: NADH-quinone oxidoreductase subunit L, partial [Pseudomonadales bacterium]